MIFFKLIRHVIFDIPSSRFTNGTTLIEMIIYLAISTALMIGVGVASMSAMDAKSKTKAVGDVYAAAVNANAQIDQVIRGGTLLLWPSWNTSSSTLIVVSGASSTTLFQSGGVLYMRNGTSAPQVISGSEVKFSNLTFSAVGASTSTAVRLMFTVAASSTGVSNEFQYLDSFIMTDVLGKYR